MIRTYGHKVRWLGKHGAIAEASVSGLATPEEAKIRAFYLAERCGYTPPRWWEIMRWVENPNGTAVTHWEAPA